MLRARLGADVPVALAMRYGRPGIAEVLRDLVGDGVERVAVLPLFPQESSAARGSAVAKVEEEAARLGSAAHPEGVRLRDGTTRPSYDWTPRRTEAPAGR